MQLGKKNNTSSYFCFCTIDFSEKSPDPKFTEFSAREKKRRKYVVQAAPVNYGGVSGDAEQTAAGN